MDHTEDLSARVLLQHILSTEPPRTPVSRSVSQAASGSGVRRSSRFSRKDAEPQTPQNILRRSLRNRIHESITRKSLPAAKQRTASVVSRKQAPSTSMLFNEGETPRHLLMNILQTEPAKSPVVHEKVATSKLQPPSDDITLTRTRTSIELSGLDLPDITMGNAVSTTKGLSRKRPRRSLNVTAFEKRIRDGNDAEDKESENSTVDYSSLSLSSSTSLSLKTPVVDIHTEKRGLQRRVSNRRKITEEEFSAALNKQQTGDVSRHMGQERNIGEDTNFEGITLGRSKLSEPDITVDIVNFRTALYDQHDAMTSHLSILATQDKPTVMASQLQRDVQEMQEEEERQKPMNDFFEEEAASDLEKHEGVSESQDKYINKTFDKSHVADVQDSYVSLKSQKKEVAVGYQTFDLGDPVDSVEVEAQTEGEAAADSEIEREGATVGPQAEVELMDRSTTEEEAEVESQSSGLDKVEAQTEQQAVAYFQSEEDEAAVSSQMENEDMGQSQTEEDEVTSGPQTEDEVLSESQPEEADAEAESQTEGEGADPHSDEDFNEDEADAEAESQTEGDGADPHSDEDFNEDEADAEAESQTEGDGADPHSDEDFNEDETDQEKEWASQQLERDVGPVSRRAYHSEGGDVLPAMKVAADSTDATAAAQSHTESKGQPEPSLQDKEKDSWRENDPLGQKNASFHLLPVSHDGEIRGQPSDINAEKANADDAAEQEEEWDEEDDYEEFPNKTPAFVREKINFFMPHPPAPSVLKNLQASTSDALPAPKPKPVRRRRSGLARKKTVLPKTYLMSVFKHFAKTKVSADVFPVLDEIMDKFFDRVAEDLETYASHAKRKTIEVEDVKLLLRRQGYINDKVPVEVLIEKYLGMDERKILIPIATSGNVVIPKLRK